MLNPSVLIQFLFSHIWLRVDALRGLSPSEAAVDSQSVETATLQFNKSPNTSVVNYNPDTWLFVK
ncbi:MAG: hypothetical protein V7K89_09330 [Nostoc sp.]|uniref:hypothetical protein n=1 Tax=Nostoc sp. TaxID=1180 RepID=UPI002FF46BC7